MFHVCALMYGNHHDLASRCLSSIARLAVSPLVGDVRLGLNQVSPQTRTLVHDFSKTMADAGVTVHVYRHPANHNNMKYPTMREMFYGKVPLTQDCVMWFDDDSCFTGSDPAGWLTKVAEAMKTATVIGAPYFQRLPWSPDVAAKIAKQPWYTGMPMNAVVEFATGGWWTAKREFLVTWDYPFSYLWHNGGDRLLGELLRQQRLPVGKFREGLAINANEHGHESRAKRRGYSSSGDDPFVAAHYDLDFVVETHGGRET